MRRDFRGFWGYARRSWQAVALALALAIACSANPEIANHTQVIDEGGALGESCSASEECASKLCSRQGLCTEACKDDADCGDEACMSDGLCSVGLARHCKTDKGCTSGLVCSSFQHCAVPCQAGTPGVCKGGAACRTEGNCPTDADIELSGIGGAGGHMDPEEVGGEGGGPGCIDANVTFVPQIPTVLLLIDRSGSMNADGKFGDAVAQAVQAGTYALGDCPLNNDWRWNVVRDVLLNPVKGIVKPLEDRVRFGMSLYSSRNGKYKPRTTATDPFEIDPTKMCPELIDVPIALANHQAMLDQFQCGDISDDTPTGESLMAAATTLKAFAQPGPKVLVLATDGEPDTCACPDFGNTAPPECRVPGLPAMIQAEVVATAAAIHADDITIHVINVSTPTELNLQQHLADVATAGGGDVYPGFSPGALSDAFEKIIDGVRECKIDLDGEIKPGKEASGEVTLDGDVLALDDPDGWQVNSSSQIELLGSACETIKRGDHDLQIHFPCDSFERPPVLN